MFISPEMDCRWTEKKTKTPAIVRKNYEAKVLKLMSEEGGIENPRKLF